MSQLADTLRHAGITHVFVCGLAWDFCVKATAIDAAKEGFTTFAIHDASRGIDRSAKGPAATREEMEKHGVRASGPQANARRAGGKNLSDALVLREPGGRRAAQVYMYMP
ncbi:NAD(+) salvage pathway protein [Rachicladosporium monterosium]|uniref:nicotinamidase n=1 Tax=Rachicladosporium monterosium TaxID=1507873 RepID=A0ABR0LF13_9PEZI|nr:NAD(+) salvage pathway protein [Rachicladosporium monterosium]